MNVSAPTAGYTTDGTAPLRWRNPRDVEFNFARAGTEWTEARCTVANVSRTSQLLVVRTMEMMLVRVGGR